MNKLHKETIFGDHRLWWLALAALIGVIVVLTKFGEAFPAAGLDLSVPRSEIERQAKDWARKLGYKKEQTIDSTTFDEDENAKTFLEFELGSQRANELMRTTIPVWTWDSRFCREGEAEQCNVYLAPDGHFLKFSLVIPNDFALPSLSRADAEKLARAFVTETAGRSLDGYKLISDQTITHRKRSDHSFVWENEARDFKGARERCAVTIRGNLVAGLNVGLHLPEEWNRRYEKMRSYNIELAKIADGFYTALLGLSGLTFLWAVTQHKIRWRFTLAAAALFSLIQTAESLNGFPAIVSQYNPLTHGYNAYITEQFFSRLLYAAALFVFAVLIAGSAEVVYRTAYPNRLALENLFKARSLATGEVAKGIFVGYLGAMVQIGWVVAYYLLGKNIGFFTPLQVENYQSLASFVPAYSAVALGVFAASHEELLYRVVALCMSMMLIGKIPFFKRHALLVFWLGNLFQATCWGFAHSNYPQQPSYARGIELSVAGLFFGCIFQTFGLLPVLVYHYVLDCYLDSRMLLSSAQPVLLISGAFAVAIFFLLALYGLKIRQGKTAPDDVQDLTNASISALQYRAPVQESEAPRHFSYVALSSKLRVRVPLVFICLFIVSFFIAHPLVVARNAHLRVDRAQAEKISEQSLRARGIDPAQYQRVSWLSSDAVTDDLQYVWEKVGNQATCMFANLEDFGLSWTVRYFKPQQIGEYQVLIDSRGSENTVNVTESEDAPGKSLTEEEATSLARSYMQKHHVEFSPLTFASIETYHRPKREDYKISFESPFLRVGDATLKAQVNIAGDQVSEFREEWELPDTWKDAYAKKTFKDEVANIVQMLSKIVVLALTLWWFIGVFRSGAVKWRLPLILTAAMAIVAVINELNGTLTIMQNYPTSNTIDTFISKQVMDSISRVFASALGMFISSLIAFSVFKMMAPETSITAVMRVGFRPADDFELRQQQQLWLDAVVAGLSFAVARTLLQLGAAQALSLFSPSVQVSQFSSIVHFANVYSPQLDATTGCLNHAIRECLYMAVFVGLYQRFAGSFKKAALFLLPLILLQYCQERYWQDYLIDVVRACLEWTTIYFFVAKFARKNLFAYLMLGLFSEVLTLVPLLCFHAGKVMFGQIIWLVLLGVLPIVWSFWLFSNKIARPKPPTDGSAAPAS